MCSGKPQDRVKVFMSMSTSVRYFVQLRYRDELFAFVVGSVALAEQYACWPALMHI